MNQIIKLLSQSDFIGKIVHTLNYCLKSELSGCESVLDLGCGPSSPLQFCKNIQYSVGVEGFAPYLEQSKSKKIHNKYLSKDFLKIDFPKYSFDAVILIEVLEHLSKKDGLKILKKASTWAKKKVVLSTPNGYFPMGDVDQNSFQRHRSGWTVTKLNKLGYICHGVSGFKFFYHQSNQVASLSQKDGNFANIRLSPKSFFYMINGLLQPFAYFFPKHAFGLFAVKSNV